jgi:hypothetical protein
VRVLLSIAALQLRIAFVSVRLRALHVAYVVIETIAKHRGSR